MNALRNIRLAERDTSKLLLYRNGEVKEDTFFNLPNYLPKGL